MHETVDEDHLTVQLAQVAGDLEGKRPRGSSALPGLVPGTSLITQSSHVQGMTETTGPEQFEIMQFSHLRRGAQLKCGHT